MPTTYDSTLRMFLENDCICVIQSYSVNKHPLLPDDSVLGCAEKTENRFGCSETTSVERHSTDLINVFKETCFAFDSEEIRQPRKITGSPVNLKNKLFLPALPPELKEMMSNFLNKSMPDAKNIIKK